MHSTFFIFPLSSCAKHQLCNPKCIMSKPTAHTSSKSLSSRLKKTVPKQPVSPLCQHVVTPHDTPPLEERERKARDLIPLTPEMNIQCCQEPKREKEGEDERLFRTENCRRYLYIYMCMMFCRLRYQKYHFYVEIM